MLGRGILRTNIPQQIETGGGFTGTKMPNTHFQATDWLWGFPVPLSPHPFQLHQASHSEAPLLTNIDGPASFHSQLPRLWRKQRVGVQALP